MAKEVRVLFLLIVLIFAGFVSAAIISDDLHLNIQTTDSSGNIITGSYNFTFNITNVNDCSNVTQIVYSNSTILTTDSRGIISYYLPNVTLNYDRQYWLCYYRDDVLKDTSKIVKTPYAFRAINISAEGIINNSNINLRNYNVTGNYGFFANLGSFLNKVTKIFVTDINASGNVDILKNLTVDANTLFVDSSGNNIGIGTTTPQNTLNVIGDGNFTGNLYSNGNSVLTSYTETDSLAYNGTLAYNSSLANYYLKTNPFSFYNSTSLTTLSQLTDDLGNRGYTNNLNFTNGAGYYNSTDFSISNYYLKTNPFSFFNSTSLNSLSQLTDDLGNRGYTNNLNFTNGAGYYNSTDFSISSYVPYTGASSNLDLGNNNFSVGGDTTLGTSSSDTLYVNSNIGTNLIPVDNTRDLGSSANRWRVVYVDNLNANNLTAGNVNIGGTTYDTFTIFTNNTGNDIQDISLAFERGTPVTNAVLKWDSTNKRFDFNFPLYIEPNNNLTVGTNTLFADGINNKVGIGTTTPQNKLNVLGDGNFTGNLYSNGKQVINWANAINGTLALTSSVPTNNNQLTNGNNYWNNTFATFNKTYADTIYYLASNPSGYISSYTETDSLAYNGTLAYNSSLANYYSVNNPNSYYNSTSLTTLSQLTDNLGDRGYTNNLNFTNGAGYYNSTDFSISSYYLKTNPFSFYNSTSLNSNSQLTNGNSYYNSSTIPSYILTSNEGNLNVNSSVYWNGINSFSGLNNQVTISGENITAGTISFARLPTLNYKILSNWANISDAPTNLSFFTDNLGNRGYTNNLNFTNGAGYYNSTSLTTLSQLTDDLGNRGYTSLSNFTDNLGNRGYTNNLNFTNGAGYYNSTDFSISNYVPYTGASSNLDLGTYTLNAGNVNVTSTGSYLYDGVQALKLAKGTDTYYANSFVGANAGNSTAKQQTALGYSAGNSNTGVSQTALGYSAGKSNTGNYQTALGYNAGNSNTGNYQTVVGISAGGSNTGTSQTAIGSNAGYQNTGNYSIGLGYEATKNNTANNVVAIGYQAGKNNIVANQFIVQQANVNSVPLIQGDFLSGNVGIGTANPQNTLNVIGDGNFTGNLYSNEINVGTWLYNQTTPAINKILGFSYYNSTDFSISNYYLKTNPFSFFNSTSLTSLSQLTDDLGNRGYTNNLNFTNGAGYYNSTDFSISSYVPYTGASSNLDLGNNNFSVGTNKLFVNSNTGNVGINTTTPKNTLNVIGTFNATSSGSSLRVDSNGDVKIGI